VVPTAAGVVLALRRTIVHFDLPSGKLTTLCEVEPAALDNRLNEAKCDRDGRLWVGSMRDFAAATTGSLYRIDAALRPERVLTGITIPNSLGWSPDGAAMFFCDTAEGFIRRYAYDRDTAALGVEARLAGSGALPGKPDGCAVDAEGHVWTTRVGAGLVVRLAPDGRESGRIVLPTIQPTSCALGGADLATLFITTARQRLDAGQLQAQPTAGHLFAQAVDVPGLPEPEFRYRPA
jgi:sugar lactone lactonase YvrE